MGLFVLMSSLSIHCSHPLMRDMVELVQRHGTFVSPQA